MSAFDYTFEFSDIGSQPSFVKVINHLKGTEHCALITCAFTNAFRSVSPGSDMERASDNFKLATIVYVCDWLARRHAGESRRIQVVAPALHPMLLNQTDVATQLKKTLYYFTGDDWQFEWYQQSQFFRPVAQTQMDLLPSLEVALWSGGLDSAAGFLKRWHLRTASNYLLVGTGANDSVFGFQRQVFAEASLLTRSKAELLQIPINLLNAAEIAKEPSQRSRGFVFLLVGATCAYLRNQQLLHVYENGVGAINLPYCSAELGLDHARSVHPNSLWEMSQLVTELLGKNFEIRNPFLFETKSQMCEPLAGLDNSALKDYFLKTSSCDSAHRQKDRPSQCGYCSSCLLRRQALAVNGIHDETRYALFAKLASREDGHALRSMLHQVGVLESCLAAPSAWPALSSRFPELIEVFTPAIQAQAGGDDVIRERLIALFRRYCAEWKAVVPQLAPGLIDHYALAA